MSDPWYQEVGPLAQGDLVINCPVVTWTAPGAFAIVDDELSAETGVVARDVIVMTQACDLKQGKVTNVVLCPAFPLSTYRTGWQAAQIGKGQKGNADEWKKFCKSVASGYQWNLAMLNQCSDPKSEHRIVDFRDVHSTPREIIEKVLASRTTTRLRLKPPYREHLSQAFARFFMRVGLPVDVDVAW